MRRWRALAAVSTLALLAACGAGQSEFDVIIRGGTVYDGSGAPGVMADVGIIGDSVAAVGDLASAHAPLVIDATGLAVAPGFINTLSWSNASLLHDARSMSGIMQGVTLEIMGEGTSMGPLNEDMKRRMVEEQGDIRYDVEWTTLGEYLAHLERRGVATNVASMVGATTVRIHVLGYEDRQPNAAELEQMRQLVADAMAEGALGVGSSLIYAPAAYARTDELVALASEAGRHGGIYTSHIRSEGDRFIEAVEEALTIARESHTPVHIYHLKAAGEANWSKMDSVIALIDGARRQGLGITTDMYTYTAGATGLNAAMPPWVQEGGLPEWRRRLQDPATRARVLREMRTPSNEWESLYLLAGSPERVVLTTLRQDSLKYLTGKTLAEVARMRGTSPEETAMDLVVQDDSRVGAVYFLMSEDNIRRQIALPWMSFGSDAASMANEGVFLRSSPHPRAYGNFARLLGHYMRDEGVITLEEAIFRLTTLAAETFNIERRGALRPGMFADVVVFDPATIADRATFEEPHQYAVGVRHVLVNGVPVLRDGEHTGAMPGRFVRGAGGAGRQ